MKEPVITWDETTKEAKCIITSSIGEIVGIAKCHPDDYDFGNELTGCHIATQRALIKALKLQKIDLKSQLFALNQLYYSMKHSQKFNEKSYENKMLQRQINLIKNDLNAINQKIAEEQDNLKNYINEKDKFYVQIREMRKNKK